jgi:nitrate reductase gamma subunit
MDLLALARGPGMEVAVSICLFGVVWRIVGIVLLRGRRDLSVPRQAAWKGVRMMFTRSVPKPAFIRGILLEIVSYAWHLSLFAALLLYGPHILFFENVLRGLVGYDITDLTGIPWPALPGGVIAFLAAVAVAGLLMAVVHRMFDPVKRLISTADDYISLAVTILPLLTGLAAYAGIGARYETLLALHFLSVDALLTWFPFGKLFHPFTMFVMRGVTGVLFERKGAAL